MRVAVATGAGMILAVGVNTALELRGLVGMAGLAIYRRNLIGMWIALDVRMATVASQAAVDTGAECLPVDRNAVPRGIGHAGIGMASQAILRV